jgi:hypothetical protein
MSYTALVLDNPSHQLLLSKFPNIPADWTKYAHHMTINMGPAASGPAASMVGQQGVVKVVSFAQDERVLAVGVESLVPSKNAQKHITVAVNRNAGGKPFHSNELGNWTTMPSFELRGIILELI